jgi:hypothetical protein
MKQSTITGLGDVDGIDYDKKCVVNLGGEMSPEDVDL